METVACDLCGADDTEPVCVVRDRLHHIDGTFYLVRCRRCGLMYLNPRPTFEEMSRYYPRDYHAYRVVDDRLPLLNRLDYRYGINKRCRAVVAHTGLRGGRILDIGCATGSFLDAMRRYGDWEPYGVEIDAEAANYARAHLGLDIFIGTLADAHYPDAFFDVVTLWNVFEHLHQPQATLVEINRILREGGWLIMSVPNPDCIEAKLLGCYWAGLDAPRHLYIYSQRTLGQALARAGFTMRKIISFTGRYHVLALSLEFVIDDKISSEKWRRWLKGVIRSIPMRLLALPYYAIADRLNQSSVMTVFAQR
ncbi:MAG TPA: class I SAM-dependent methyltransferase [Thermoflexus sp.]|nr:class I SAM-dependent methyltransferase [Thermoflexus sp.]